MYCHNINVALLWVIPKIFFLLDSVRYRDNVMTTLKFYWSTLKILMSGWYRKLKWSSVLFTIWQQCHTDIGSDVTPISLQYQNVHWDTCRNLRIDVLARALFSSSLLDQSKNGMASKCFDGNLYCYKKIRYFVRKSQIFDQLQLKQVSLSAAKFW